MKSLEKSKIKCKIFFEKNLLNLLLFVFSPTNKIMVALSQDLDKYIVLYQKYLFIEFNYNKNDDNCLEKIVA